MKRQKLLFSCLLVAMATAASAQVTATYSGTDLELGNEYLSRHFTVQGGKLKTTSLVNKRTSGGSTTFVPASGSEEFAVSVVGETQAVTDPSVLSRTGWTATCDSWCVDNAKGGKVDYLLDGQKDTYWHSNYQGTGGTGEQAYPHWFTVDAGKSVSFVSFGYLPRQDFETVNGNIGEYELYVSDNLANIESGTPVAKGTFAYDGVSEIRINLDAPVTARYIRLKGLSAHNGQAFAGGAEFNLYTEKAVQTIKGFKASDLTVNDVQISDIAGGKHVTVNFAPYTYKEVAWTVKMHLEMKDGEHYMRKWLELSVPAAQASTAAIDYIDFESMGTAAATDTWTHPTMSGGVGGMNGYFIALGQPVYVDGMFFGSEFPMADNQIDNGVARVRYYSGKTFSTLSSEGRLTDGAFSTWKAVAGATRSTSDMNVIRSDFFSYINDIATPTKVRFQYNSWYDWMMDITKDNIITSFKEMERGFSQNGLPPMDSYVVDDGWNAYGPYQGENTTGFWQFNSKFPNGLTEPSDFAHRIGSNFGLWLGPRGGYNYNYGFAQFLESNGNGKLNTNSGDITTNHKVYLQKLQAFFLDCQQKYDINYWKLDGFSTAPAQADNAGNYITGGTQGMYYMTEHWERWIDILTAIRAEGEGKGLNYWLNLTCYINPSPWYLQWANTLWMQNSNDMGRLSVGGRTRDVDQLLTYRDGRYYDFINTREFQFPLSNIFNHDPTYGKTNCVAANAMTAAEFRTYLMMMATRGTAFWEMLYSYNLMNETDKWTVNAEVMNWVRENYDILRHAKMFGKNPEGGNAYGFSAWNGGEGIISVRNPSGSTANFTFTLDRNIGLAEGTTGLRRATVLNANTTTADDNTATFNYGQQISLSMAPGEVRIWQFSAEPNTTAATAAYVRPTSTRFITLQFDKQMENLTKENITVDGTAISGVSKNADKRTFTLRVTTDNAFEDGKTYTLGINGATDIWGNATHQTLPFTYYASNAIANANAATDFAAQTGIEADESGFTPVSLAPNAHALSNTQSFAGTGDLNVSLWLNTTSSNCTVISQGADIQMSIDASGKLVFTVGGVTTTTDVAVNDGNDHFISACRERNGMVKIYVDGQVNASTYNASKVDPSLNAATVTLGGNGFTGKIGHFELRDKAYTYAEVETLAKKTYPTAIGAVLNGEEKEVELRPIPVRNILTVSNLQPNSSLTLYSISGKRIMAARSADTRHQLDMSRCTSGHYLLAISHGSATRSYKVVKE